MGSSPVLCGEAAVAHFADHIPAEALEEDQADDQGSDLRDGEGDPDEVIIADALADAGQHICHRQQHHQLAAEGSDHGVSALAQRLEYGVEGDADCRDDEVGGDDAQGRFADGHQDGHLLGGGILDEDPEQRAGDRHENQGADGHDYGCGAHAYLHGLEHAVLLLGAIVVGDDGHDAVVHAEDGHEDEAVELKVAAEDILGIGATGGEVEEDDVEEEGHHRADRHHDDAGHADGADALDDAAVRMEAAQADMQLVVLLAVKIDGQQAGHDLAEYGGGGSAGHAHIQQEDADGVEDDIDDRAHALGNHGVDGFARGGEQALHGDLAEHAEGQAAYNGHVVHSVLDHGFILGLHGEEGAGAENAEQEEQHIAAGDDEDAVVCHAVGMFRILCAQGAGDQGVDAHAHARGKADHQVLRREGQGNGVQRLLGNHADEHGVYNIIERLHQHGNYDGQRHGRNQLADGHYAHLVFLYRLILHSTPLYFYSHVNHSIL